MAILNKRIITRLIKENQILSVIFLCLFLYSIIYQFFNIPDIIVKYRLWNYATLLYDLSLAAIVGIMVYVITSHTEKMRIYKTEMELIRKRFHRLHFNVFSNLLNPMGFKDYPVTEEDFENYEESYENRPIVLKKVFELEKKELFECFSGSVAEIVEVTSITNPLYDLMLCLKVIDSCCENPEQIGIKHIKSTLMVCGEFNKKLKEELEKI